MPENKVDTEKAPTQIQIVIMSKVLADVRHAPKGSTSDSSVQEHLITILSKLLETKPDNPLDLFTSLSTEASHGKYVAARGKPTVVVPQNKNRYKGFTIKENNFAKSYITLVKPPPKEKKPKTGDDDEPEPEPEEEEETKKGADLVYEARLFNAVGHGFSDAELYHLVYSIKRLVEAKKLKSHRLFGKINGTDKNYYILETDQKEEEEGGGEENADEDAGEKEKKKEIIDIPLEKKTGTNKYLYYVTNIPFAHPEQWTLLPDIEPKQVQAARKIKRHFTGDLSSKMACHPPFPGEERHYLRAQIARIAAATTIAPKGVMELEEPEEEPEDETAPKKDTRDPYEAIPALKNAEEFSVKTLNIHQLDNWVHLFPSILQTQGRASLYKEETEEEEPAEDDEEPKKKEPVEYILPILSSIDKESKLDPNLKESVRNVGGWLLRKHNVVLDSKLVSVKSTRWPGAVTVGEISEGQLKFANLYIGTGHKFDVDPFTPAFVEPVMVEYSEPLEEQVDPTPEEMEKYKEPIPEPVKAEPEDGAGDGGDGGDGGEGDGDGGDEDQGDEPDED